MTRKNICEKLHLKLPPYDEPAANGNMEARFTQPLRKKLALLGNLKKCCPHFSYLEEDVKDVRVGAGEEDDGEEGADASVEHGGPDLGQRLLDPLIPAPLKVTNLDLF